MNYYDKDGHEIGFHGWSKLFMVESYRRVALDQVADTEVSTVWVGCDDNHGHGHPPPEPLIFETMTLPGEDLWRYATLQEAKDGHSEVVAALHRE